MNRWTAPIPLLVLVMLVAHMAQAQQTPSAFRAGVDVVSLNVTVTDPASHYVVDLDQSDFAVFEDGVRQQITFFNRRRQPIALSLLLDSSASMEQNMPTLKIAAANFVQRLTTTDLAQIIDFDSRVQVMQTFTSSKSDLQAAIEQATAGGSTSLYNAIYIALRELQKIRATSEADVRRQAIILFSDGEDTSSLVPFEDVLDLARRSEVAIYAIALRGADVQSKGFNEAEFVMRSLSRETGGRAFFPTKITDLAGVYAEIADELASQYTLGYTSSNAKRNGTWRRVNVQVARTGTVARTKNGYYATTTR